MFNFAIPFYFICEKIQTNDNFNGIYYISIGGPECESIMINEKSQLQLPININFSREIFSGLHFTEYNSTICALCGTNFNNAPIPSAKIKQNANIHACNMCHLWMARKHMKQTDALFAAYCGLLQQLPREIADVILQMRLKI